MSEEKIQLPDALSDQLVAIEREVDSNRYRAGPWTRVVNEVRALPIAERRSVAENLSRISRKLHQRSGRSTVSVPAGYLAELGLAIAGAVVLALGSRHQSNLLVIVSAVIWTIAFQPLIKVAVGCLLGVRYEYAYLYGFEPRFKMCFGQYLAQPRYARLLLHLSGTIGSPIGAWLPTLFVDPSLRVAIYVCWVLFWTVVAINVLGFVAVLSGVRSRIGSIRLGDSSGGAAALELREALEI
ncbi:MAG TPA: hypothetical protein VGI36_04500 [Candidatus Binataceae bacterium]|jgi:hypothetical protein